jgi:hypothetical protein
MELLQHLETGKFAKFITSIQTLGDGPLHLVEDLETSFLSAYPTLEKYRVVTQEVIDEAAKVADGIETVSSEDPNSEQTVAVTSPTQSTPVPVPANVNPGSPAQSLGAQPASTEPTVS